MLKPILVREANHVGPGFTTSECLDCVDPNLRAAVANITREELDLENLSGKFTGATGAGRPGGAAIGAGDGADGEGTFAAKGGGRQRRRARGLAAATQ